VVLMKAFCNLRLSECIECSETYFRADTCGAVTWIKKSDSLIGIFA